MRSGSVISSAMRAATSFSGDLTPETRASMSAKLVNGPFFLSSRMACMVFFPSPGSSSRRCFLMETGPASL